ncbi:HNH endonuclease [Hymenobacter sp. P5252]|uniref:HNH endonuclease n=1 Tax=Hymenobacter terrestris TaxID=2748310 RepID=A0ABX2Q015_9BACT|nr:HNH endonuclease [Hymenobacter terrestris]
MHKHLGVNRLFQLNAVNHLFTKVGDSSIFEYVGQVQAQLPESEGPIRVLWNVVNTQVYDYPDEVQSDAGQTFFEGATTQVLVNKYERNTEARKACIAHYGGPTCQICDFNFFDKYGSEGEGLIHVHHLKPLASIGETYQVNPTEDLIPVCPNCHAMLHRKNPPYLPKEIGAMLLKTCLDN